MYTDLHKPAGEDGYPNFHQPHITDLAIAIINRANYDKALEAYNRSMAVAPATGLTFLFRANVLAASGRHEEAIQDYDRADNDVTVLQRRIQDVVLYNRGNSKAQIGDLQGAIQDYTQALNWDPNNPQVYYNRGNAYLDLYQFQEAFSDFEVASNMDGSPGPREANYLFNKGIALMAMGQLSEARDAYQDASRGRANDEGIHQNLDEGIHQNLWTLNRIIALVHGLDYAVNALPDGDSGNMRLRFSLPEGYEPVGRELQRLLLFGREGSTGNTGGPGLVGRAGLLRQTVHNGWF